MIGHVVVLSGFQDRPHPIRLVTKSQFRFRLIPHIEDRSNRCPV